MKSSLRDLGSELRADILSAKAIPALSAGFTSGLGLLVAQVAFGSFIFSGPLAPFSSQGVGLVLFGNFAACLVVALAGGYRGAIAGLSPAPVIVMASVATKMDARGEALFVTTAVALMISAVATGVCCLMIGRFRLANLVRFIPCSSAPGSSARSARGGDKGHQRTKRRSVQSAISVPVVRALACGMGLDRGSRHAKLTIDKVAIGCYFVAHEVGRDQGTEQPVE